MLRWVELSARAEGRPPDRRRFDTLSQIMTQVGIANERELITCETDDFSQALLEAKANFDQIRVSGDLCMKVLEGCERMPSQMLSLKSADALTQTDGTWWPRNYLFEGLGRALIGDLGGVDLDGAVFLLGATSESRAVIAGLVRIGFNRFSISDPVEEHGLEMIKDLRTSYFNIQFQFVSRHLITQLPSIHSIAINTLNTNCDDGALGELFYFNFLKPGGVWIDLALCPPNVNLTAEARSVGAIVEPGTSIAAWTDAEWLRDVCAVKSRELATVHADNPKPTLVSAISGAYAQAFAVAPDLTT